MTKKPTPLIACVFGMTMLALPLSGQTVGGHTALSSRTWRFAVSSQSVPQTSLFTPARDGDFLMTLYVSGDGNGTECPHIEWTDEFGSHTYPPLVMGPNGSGYVGNCAQTANASVNPLFFLLSFPIHVSANTTVSTSVEFAGPTAAYTFSVGRIKLNP